MSKGTKKSKKGLVAAIAGGLVAIGGVAYAIINGSRDNKADETDVELIEFEEVELETETE